MLATITLVALIALVVAVAWPWRVEATLKATTHESIISLAGGLELAGLSGSAAAILGGPGVVAIHLRARELWRRAIPRVSPEAFLAWLEEPPREKEARSVASRAKDALVARTDVAELPAFGLRVLLGLRDVSLAGTVRCGFSDPALTGKTAAWLYPVAGVLAPFGTIDVSFDWTGRSVLDAAIDVSFRVVPAKLLLEGLRFARRHVHLRRKGAALSSTLPASSTT